MSDNVFNKPWQILFRYFCIHDAIYYLNSIQKPAYKQ